MPAALVDQMNALKILPDSLAIWSLGQMGLALKGPDGLLYIDPCLSDVVAQRSGPWWQRAFDPPLRPHEVNNAALVCITHEHWDHLDPLTLPGIAQASPRARFISSGWCRALLRDCGIDDGRILTPDALDPLEISGTRLRVTAIPAAHYSRETDAEKGERWLGFLIEWNGVSLLHAGDTILYPGYLEMLRELPPIDVALLPVNGRDYFRESDVGAIGNLLPAEAARFCTELGIDLLLIGHNDLYPNNTIPRAEIAGAMQRHAPRQKYTQLQPGELLYYVRV